MHNRLYFSSTETTETIYAPLIDVSYTQSRYENGVLRDKYDMAIEAFAFFESKFALHGRTLSQSNKDHYRVMAEMRLDLMDGQNWYNAPPLFHFERYPREHPLPPTNDSIVMFFKSWDLDYFNRIGIYTTFGYLRTRIFKRNLDNTIPGIEWKPQRMYSLRELCMQKVSTYNRMYAGDSLGPYVVASTANLYPNKIVNLVKKYDKPTRYCKLDSTVSIAVGYGLNYMYDYMGMKEHFSSLIYTHKNDDVTMMRIPQITSNGIKKGLEERRIKDGVVYITTPNGQKIDQELVTKRHVLDLIDKYKETGKFDYAEQAWCICDKFEIFATMTINEKERDDFYLKCREFFISALVPYIVSNLVQGDRQKFERGKMIKIGLRWWHGGAQYFADQMKYNDKDMVFFDGDFKSLDTSIKKHLLELYSMQALIYYDPNKGDYSLLEAMCKKNSENLAVKITHIFGRSWKVLFGTMPSGAFETSHGNSWIVGLLFFSYLAYTIMLLPHRVRQIFEMFKNDRIQFPVYGDDHMIAVDKSISDIINEEGYANFVSKNFQMTITKMRGPIKFLSTPSISGNLIEEGCVFLKRYFIESSTVCVDLDHSLPHVLPYKRFQDFLPKLAWGNSPRHSLIDYAVSSIGLVYDSMGTNPLIYEMCHRMYVYCMKLLKINNDYDLKAAFFKIHPDATPELDRMCRKLNMTLDEILNGFPTRKHILSKHVYDPIYVDFSMPVQRYNAAKYEGVANTRVFSYNF